MFACGADDHDRPMCHVARAMRIPVREPYDWDRVLAWLDPRSIPDLESVEDGVYRRGDLTVARADGGLEVTGPADPVALARVFDTAHDPAQLTDPLFARAPGIRVPGTWSGWELAVRAVLGQQVSVAGARRTAHKLIELHGDGVPAAGGAGRRRAARHAREPRPRAARAGRGRRRRPRARPAARPRRAPARQLLALPGFGPWTVEYIAMRALRDPDAWPGTRPPPAPRRLRGRRRALAAVARLRRDGAVADLSDTNCTRPRNAVLPVHLRSLYDSNCTRTASACLASCVSAARTTPRRPDRGRRRGRGRRR